jgi:hypothetical protein
MRAGLSGMKRKAWSDLNPGLFILLILPATIVLLLSPKANAQQGPTGSHCTAYAEGKPVAEYHCLSSKDVNGNVNFIQWPDGTASTGLGGWKRQGRNCFASTESPEWKICRN